MGIVTGMKQAVNNHAQKIERELKEEALYYRFKAYHDLVIVSTERKKPTRIKDAFAAYDKLIRNFPESKFLKDSDKLLSEIKNEQKQLVKS